MQLEKLHSNIFLPHHLFFHDIMLEIAELKQKKLPELQEIAKSLGIKRIAGPFSSSVFVSYDSGMMLKL